jgi:hypothetical protein
MVGGADDRARLAQGWRRELFHHARRDSARCHDDGGLRADRDALLDCVGDLGGADGATYRHWILEFGAWRKREMQQAGRAKHTVSVAPPRCPLCDHPLTLTEDIDDHFACCIDCHLAALPPYLEWHPFQEDREN